jgi:hypothetical protein
MKTRYQKFDARLYVPAPIAGMKLMGIGHRLFLELQVD